MERRTDDSPLIFRIDAATGHLGGSDRYREAEAHAYEFAFLIDQLGVE